MKFFDKTAVRAQKTGHQKIKNRPNFRYAVFQRRTGQGQPIISVNFSESIDPTTVVDLNNSPQPNPNNIFLQRLDAQNGAPQIGGDLDTDNDTYIDANFLQVEEKSAGFLLSLVPPDALESFTWYKLTVQNVEDMCGNAMDPMPTLEFQTNDKIAGFKSWYPKGDNECPDVPIAATFNTSMYYHRIQFVILDLDDGSNIDIVLDWPDQTGVSSVTTPDGTLQILNADFINPGTNFTRYEFRPANPLDPGHEYHAFVYTNRAIDSAGTLLKKDWTFSVATAEDCTCAPQINGLDPEDGGWGECVTINGYCFTGTTKHKAVPDRVLFDTVNANIESFSSKYIVTTAQVGFNGPYPQAAPVTVRIDYEEATYGQVESDPFDYVYTSNTEATGPCLFSESHSSCYPGAAVTLRGIRFKNAADTTVRQVTFAAGALNAGINSWADTVITTNVPNTAEIDNHDGDVNVTNEVGTSNGIPFDICQPPPGVPIIISYTPNCSTACVNTLPTVKFNKVEMDAGTFTPGSVTLQRCSDDECTAFDFNYITNPVYFYDAAEEEGILEIDYPGNLTENRRYRVILDGAVILSTEGVKIGNLNYDLDTKFSWTFGTKNDPTTCEINETRVSPLIKTIKIGGSTTYYASAYASPNECSAAGQKLKATDYNWAWASSVPAVATIAEADANADGNVDPIQVATASAITTGTTLITPTEAASGIAATTSATLNVEDDPTSCFDNSECEFNELNQQCPGSVCLNNHCTPVFLLPPNEFSPDSGPIGTWVTLAGCWFGNYVEGKSQVTFNNNKIGKIPNEALCGKSWMNYQIIREVPDEDTPDLLDNAIDGRITVVGGNSSSYTYNPIATSDSFDVDLSAKGPQICALAPTKGIMGTAVTVRGEGFETPRNPAWNVTFFDAPASRVNVSAADYGTWVDQNIEGKVPTAADSGGVQVDKNGDLSNLYGFQVLPPACIPCENDFVCNPRGCGYDGCCHDRPTIVSTTPTNGQVDVCLNAAIRINFSEKMDKNTITTGVGGTVVMWREAIPPAVQTQIDLTDHITVRDRSITINLGLLERHHHYLLSLNGPAIRNIYGVAMAGSQEINFYTADTDAACEFSKLELVPASHTFTALTQNQNFDAIALDGDGNPLSRVPGVYDWNWVWSSDDKTTVAITTNSDADGQIDWQTATPQKNGNTRVKVVAQATAGWEGEKTATAPIRVMICDLPWQYEDAAGNCDVLPGTCGDYNFDLFYCQGGLGYCENDTTNNCLYSYTAIGCPSADLDDCCPNVGEKCIYPAGNLPDFDLKVERGTADDVLKQFLFKESDKCVGMDVSCTADVQCSIYEPDLICGSNKDGIGIRIYANPEGLSPRAWYDTNIDNAGSPSSTTVDGYEAVRDGRTVYVAAANVVGGNIYNNIYLISYNDDA
ncbi:MAG: Ig-like domain-containing protein, partial [Planctomycetota bacterium]